MKQAMKKSKDASGILSLNKNLVNDVDDTVKKWIDSAKKQGQNIDKMGEQEIKYIVELNKPKAAPHTLDTLAELVEKLGLNDPKKNKFLQKKGEVFDLSGKKIDEGKPILGGKNVPEEEGFSMTIAEGPQTGKKITMDEFFELTGAKNTSNVDIVTETITKIKTLKPIDAMKEANSVIARKGKYKNLTKEQSQEILKKTDDHIFERDIKYDEFGEIIKPDPEDFAHGGRTGSGLNYLLGEDDQNFRVPFGLGGMGRRAFLKMMGAGAAGTAAAKTGLFSLLKGGAKKEVIKDLTSVSIKSGVDGMPVWFKPLVNKVIKEGEDVTKKFATQERQIVHKTELPDSGTDVLVTQDLTTGNVSVDIGLTKHGFADGKFGQPVRLEYKASEVIEGPIKKGKPTKTKEEFNVEEAEFTGGHPENIKFEESTFSKFGKHESNFSEVEAFSKGKPKKDVRKVSESLQKEGEDLADHFSNYPTPDDFASGGRVPLGGGGIAGMLGE